MLEIAQAPAHYGGAWWAVCPHCEWLGTFHGETEAKEAYETHQEEKHDRTPRSWELTLTIET